MDMDSIFGLMEAYIKEISSMELGMAMESGKMVKKLKFFQAAIGWTRRKGSECMSG